MTQVITSISVPESNPDGINLLINVKTICKSKGFSFSFIVLQGLKLWLKEYNDGRD